MVQQGFPIENRKDNISDIRRMYLEGRQYNGVGRTLPSAYPFNGIATPETDGANLNAVTPTSPQPLPGFVPTITKCIAIQDYTAECSSDIYLQKIFGGADSGFRGVVGPNNPLHIQGPIFVKPGKIISGNILGLTKPTTPIGNRVLFTESMRAFTMSADLNWSANKSILLLGDSNFEGSAMGLTRVSDGAQTTRFDVVTWLLRNWYRVNGNDVRLIDFSVAGWASPEFENLRLNGDLEMPEQPSLIIYAVGTNDRYANIHLSNLTKFLTWAQSQYPSSKILVLGPIPKQGSTTIDGVITNNEALLNTIRTNSENLVNQINKPDQIAFINCGLAWDVNDNSKYSNFDGTADGSHIHPNSTGMIDWFNFIINEISNVHTDFIKI